jgi:hypothetical protein
MEKNVGYAELTAEERAEEEKSSEDEELDASATNIGRAGLLGAEGKRKRAEKDDLKKGKMRKRYLEERKVAGKKDASGGPGNK